MSLRPPFDARGLTAGACLGWLVILAPPPDAQAADTDLAACAAIASDRSRLACYDRAAGRAPTPLAEPQAGTAAMSAPAATPSPGPTSAAGAGSGSLLESAWGFRPDSDRYAIGLYRPNYLLLASYSSRPNDAAFEQLFTALDEQDAELDSTEAQFQISFKARLWSTEDRRLGLWAAYTQQNQWQVYNDALSRPFRETNYQPELLVSYDPDLSLGGFRWGLLNFAYNHQSNGRSDPISRSWDRLIAEFGIERDNFALLVRPWYVIDEGGDDNPDITDYYGHGDITGIYKWRGHSFTLMGRGNIDTQKGAVQLTWTSPPLLGPLRAYVSGFSGYGQSMIDYDWRQNVIGAGVALNDLLDPPLAGR
jgi:phospholipase A1